MTNTFGEFFRITTWGESHGPGIGVVIDGVPSGVPIVLDEIAAALRRRRPGGPLASPRAEPDEPEVMSGVFEGRSLGSPIAIWIPSRDSRPSDYEALRDVYRPGHADFTTDARYGRRDHRGGGRASARETAARVAAGAVALSVLRSEPTSRDIEIVAWVDSVADLRANVDPALVTRAEVERSIVRCPDHVASGRMIERISRAREAGDSVGGWVAIVARGVPAGWGDPVFGKIKALLGSAYLSIPATVALEIGDGLAATTRAGSENNDPHTIDASGQVVTRGNRAGGVQGGITNGAALTARIGFKPTSTIRRSQETVDRQGRAIELEAAGRHDPCVLPRAVPVVEAMTALVLADRMLARRATPPFEE